VKKMNKVNRKIKKLSSVLIPMTSWEILQLEVLFELWRLWELAGGALSKKQPSKELVISFDCSYSQTLNEHVSKLYTDYQLNQKFTNLNVIFCDIADEDNIYIRKNDEIPKTLPRLGYASGPNNQFFKTMRELNDKEYVLLNETDCVPIRADWLEQIGKRVFWNESFWVMGSSYKGITELNGDISNHVNGNAIYAAGSSEFNEFLNDWESGLAEVVKTRNYMAYDVYLAYKEHSTLNTEAKGPTRLNTLKQLKDIRNNKSKFVYTSLILNSSANQDIISKDDINSLEYQRGNPEISVCHGRHFIIQSYNLVKSILEKKQFSHTEQDVVNIRALQKKLIGSSNESLVAILTSLEKMFCEQVSFDNQFINNKKYISSDFLANLKATESEKFTDENIIFLLGNPRSGTTLLQKLISTSTNVETTGEPWLQLFLQGSTDTTLVSSKFDQKLMVRALDCVEEENNTHNLLNDLLKDLSLKYYSGLKNSINQNAKYFMDKTPRYSVVCDKIVKQHPNSKYILITRNPFDIACSVITAWTSSVDEFLCIESFMADFEIGLVKLAALMKTPPTNLLICSYEEVTQNTSVELKKIAKFLQLPFSEFSLDYSKNSKKFEFGDDKQVDNQVKAVRNRSSWRSALKCHEDYLKLCKYLEELPAEVLAIMNYNAPAWQD